MLKISISIIIVSIFAAMALPALADTSNQQELTYPQQIQQMFDRANTAAKNQFARTYPKPTAPAITPQSATGKDTYKLPVPKNTNPSNTTSADNSYPAYASPAITAATPSKTPDIAIGTKSETGKNKNTFSQNIFLPNAGNTDTSASTPNPYQ